MLESAVALYLLEQLRQRATGTAWDFGKRWLVGDPYDKELSAAFDSSLGRAVEHQLGLPRSSPENERVRVILLSCAPIQLADRAPRPDVPLIHVLAMALAEQVEAASLPATGLDPTFAPTSPWQAVEAEIGHDLDPVALQRSWFEEFLAEVAANRLRGGALAFLAAQFDTERLELKQTTLLSSTAALGANLSVLDKLVPQLEAALAIAIGAAVAEPPGGPCEAELRSLLVTRAQRMLNANALIPPQRIARRVSGGIAFTQAILQHDSSIILLADSGEGKSVALATALIELSSDSVHPFAALIHWDDLRDIRRGPEAEDFVRAVGAAVFPTAPTYAESLSRRLMDDEAIVLIDGLDEVAETRQELARRERVLLAARQWERESRRRFVVASRDGEIPQLRNLKSLKFVELSEAEVAKVVSQRLSPEKVPLAVERITAGHLHHSLLMLTLTAIVIQAEPDVALDDLAYSKVGDLIPRIVQFICEGRWRTDGLSNSPRVTQDLLDLAARAAWSLQAGRPPGRFSHRDLVRALDGDRSAAYELEDFSNLIVGEPQALEFVHRRVADHLIGAFAATDLGKLRDFAREHFWEHDTKYTLYDTAVASGDPATILEIARELLEHFGPALDLGIEYCAAIATLVKDEDRGELYAEVRDWSYDVCAARPIFAEDHNGFWRSYRASAISYLDQHDVPVHCSLRGEEFDLLVARLLPNEEAVAIPAAREAAAREIRMWLISLRNGRVRARTVEDTFAPTGSVIMPTPKSAADEYITLWKDTGKTNPWRERKPAIGWLLCRLHPTDCDLNGHDSCAGGWSNRYSKGIYKPFGLRCAWVSAMARDREYIQAYLQPKQLRAVLHADKFEWSRAHALLRLAVLDASGSGEDFRWWWAQEDTTDKERSWILGEIQDAISLPAVGRLLTEIADLIVSDEVATLGLFVPRVPSLLSSHWSSHWEAMKPGFDGVGQPC